MPLDLTPALRLYAAWRRRRLAALDPAAAQARELAKLVRAARGTAFGRDHDFASIRTVADFQARVPLRRYEEMWDGYWKPAFPVLDNVSWPGRIPYFAVSSGTTSGSSKYLPLSPQMRRSNVRAALDVHRRPWRGGPRLRAALPRDRVANHRAQFLLRDLHRRPPDRRCRRSRRRRAPPCGRALRRPLFLRGR